MKATADMGSAVSAAPYSLPRTVKFTILGTPVPYLRMTQGEARLAKIPLHRVRPHMREKHRRIRRYFDWKEYVCACALGKKYNPAPKADRKDPRARGKTYLNVVVYFGTGVHGDPENVRKGIQDALFEDDKYVAGSVDFGYDPGNPRCEVEIVETAP